MNRVRLLIVEDNPGDRQIVKKHLDAVEDTTFSIIEAESLAATYDALIHHDFDAILLDLHISNTHVFETLRSVISANPDVAVIILADTEQRHMAPLLIQYGAHDLIEKQQLTPSSLNKAICYAIQKKKFMREKHDLLNNLSSSLKKITLLEKHLPLCRGCNKILGTDNEWHALQTFNGTPAFTGKDIKLCPECQYYR